ncbi:hypothetical protein GCM10011492_09560 [Flexivirga endophytica]|uniref:PKD domain-containing protein n=1 Tax=Flexivirga endophytica TaxID=1849103 RepID=A0A916SXD1_9MICO|nr:hypothetical protein GCM10011492_09560 [Flexivirga endophytica]GHB59369.1 hypothetical protein GCM10008112_30580 [Flexivirga endophytica]
MLTRRRTGAGALAAGAALAFVGVAAAPSAHAAGGVSCPPGSSWDPTQHRCVITIVVPGPPGPTPTPPPTPGPPGKKPPPNSKEKCVNNATGKTIPCTYGGAWWSPDKQCYVSVAKPQPPKSDAIWGGHTAGTVYQCDMITSRFFFWSQTQPGGPKAPPDPVALAREATAAMDLKAITIGIVPRNARGSVGLVGMPQWMWVKSPAPNTWGPITKSASAAGYTVTATGKVDHIVWNMGDGQQISCANKGTPYYDAAGKSKSPTCGHDMYTKQGTYTVTATSYWVINWSGIGQSGTIPVTTTRTTTIRIGEAQVLTQ